ncbi:MAG: DNA translocase FtsK [Deltaproteobacteria bacterium]|nr:DNA translocase FtsK [Deltaproteobacteria bacterium]
MGIAIQKRRGLKQEIVGILLLALSLFSAISLISYYLTERSRPTNWGGVVGDYFSETLFFIIGLTSYTIPFVILILAVEFLLKREISSWLKRAVSLSIYLLSLSALLSLVIGEDRGGVIGQHISFYLSFYLGTTGSFISLSALFIISVVIATGFSLLDFFAALFVGGRWIIKSITSLISEKREKSEKKKGAVAKKKHSQPTIVTPITEKKGTKPPKEVQEEFEFLEPTGKFQVPPISLLDPPSEKGELLDKESLFTASKILEKKLSDFGVEGKVTEVRPGPVVTMYEFEPAPGIKVGRIINLSDDLALAMRAISIRILAPVPGKAVVGIEIPNISRETICLREILESPGFGKSGSKLGLALGKSISGAPVVDNLAKMPHLLVAGATGAGKSVFVNVLILSILYKATPEDVRFLMIDPKMLELSLYEGIPHLLTPVVTEPKRAIAMLRGMVVEMGERYKRMAEMGAKNIDGYNQLLRESPPEIEEGEETPRHRRLPYIVVIIDELADLMMTGGKDVEESLVRLSQMARAAGIHLILATQRPSVDVITGLIKSNFPARISFQVPSRTDSRTILDTGGAETLLGEGDMLFMPPGTSRIKRIHGPYLSETEIKRVTKFLKKQGKPSYDKAITEAKIDERPSGEEEHDGEFLRRFDEAVQLASSLEMISTSYIQRRFRIGYNTAARIIEKMEADGIVGPSQGSKPREVLLRRNEG